MLARNVAAALSTGGAPALAPSRFTLLGGRRFTTLTRFTCTSCSGSLGARLREPSLSAADDDEDEEEGPGAGPPPSDTRAPILLLSALRKFDLESAPLEGEVTVEEEEEAESFSGALPAGEAGVLVLLLLLLLLLLLNSDLFAEKPLGLKLDPELGLERPAAGLGSKAAFPATLAAVPLAPPRLPLPLLSRSCSALHFASSLL